MFQTPPEKNGNLWFIKWVKRAKNAIFKGWSAMYSFVHRFLTLLYPPWGDFPKSCTRKPDFSDHFSQICLPKTGFETQLGPYRFFHFWDHFSGFSRSIKFMKFPIFEKGDLHRARTEKNAKKTLNGPFLPCFEIYFRGSGTQKPQKRVNPCTVGTFFCIFPFFCLFFLKSEMPFFLRFALQALFWPPKISHFF